MECAAAAAASRMKKTGSLVMMMKVVICVVLLVLVLLVPCSNGQYSQAVLLAQRTGFHFQPIKNWMNGKEQHPHPRPSPRKEKKQRFWGNQSISSLHGFAWEDQISRIEIFLGVKDEFVDWNFFLGLQCCCFSAQRKKQRKKESEEPRKNLLVNVMNCDFASSFLNSNPQEGSMPSSGFNH